MKKPPHHVVVFHRVTGLVPTQVNTRASWAAKTKETQNTQVQLTEREGVMKASIALWF